jgi:DNA-directed RNA polymerase subunit alpha
MGLSLGMKIDENGNAVPGPTSILPSQALAQSYNRFEDEEDDLDVLEPMQNEPENF